MIDENEQLGKSGTNGLIAKNTSDPRFFGAFICLVGFAFLFVALYSLFWLGSDISSNSKMLAIGSFVTIGLSVGCLFVAVNLDEKLLLVLGFREKYESLRHLKESNTSSCAEEDFYIEQKLRKITIGSTTSFFLFVIISGIFLYFALNSSNQSGNAVLDAQQFALLLPVDGGSGGASKEFATLFWGTPEVQAAADDGLVKMFIASLLTIAFGVVYPYIARGGRDDEIGFVQKLVVPVLSALLFGVGASEQVDAEERRQDIRLVSQGLPPVIGIPNRQRDIYLLRGDDASLATRRRLQRSIDVLISRLDVITGVDPEADDPSPNPLPKNIRLSAQDRRLLLSRLLGLREQLRTGQALNDQRTLNQTNLLQESLRSGFENSETSIQKISENIANSSEMLSLQLSRMDEDQKAVACTLLQSQIAREQNQRKAIVRIVEQADNRAARDILDQLWIQLKGEDQELQRKARKKFANADDSRIELEKIAALCRLSWLRTNGK